MVGSAAVFVHWRDLWREKGEASRLLDVQEEAEPDFQWPRNAVGRLSKLGREVLQQRRAFVASLIENSRARFAPLGEPLDLDLGAHRWLRDEREEAYSDWLAWLLGRLTSGEVAELFGEEGLVPETERERPPVRVLREMWVEKGHEDASGRIDVVVILPNNRALVLELKKGCIAASDLLKQEGYFEVMEKRGVQCSYFLLVTDRIKGKKNKFTVMPYATLCSNIRRWAARKCGAPNRENLTVVAMALAFAGAVESNLLGFSISASGLSSDATIEYLLNMEKEMTNDYRYEE